MCTRSLCLLYGIKLLQRILIANHSYILTESEGFYIGTAPKLTFLSTTTAEYEEYRSFSFLRYNILEIICLAYLLSQSIKYGFRVFWWPYAGLDWRYFLIGSILISLLFIRWFNPRLFMLINYEGFSMKIVKKMSIYLSQKPKSFLNHFSLLKTNKDLKISLFVFLIFILAPILYYFLGGNFLLI